MKIPVWIKGAVLTGALCHLAACGFKSDLFIPGEPKNAGQLDSSSLEILKQRTLESLKKQDSDELDARLRELTDDQPLAPAADEGVPVSIEPLTAEELEAIEKNRDKNKQQ